MEDFKIESRYLKLCNEFTAIIRWMKAAFYRLDYPKLLMCPLIKTRGRAFERLNRVFERLGRDFKTLGQAFKGLKEN